MRFIKKVILTGITLFAVSCAVNEKRGKALIPTGSASIQLSSGKGHELKILYTGCGGLVISKDSEAVMADPYYTGHSFLRTLFGKIKINTVNTDTVLRRIKDSIINPKKIKNVLITHSHYDHLEDLPWLLSGKKLADDVQVVGSASTLRTIENFTSGITFVNADNFVHQQNPAHYQDGKWIPLSPNMRVMPIESQHAPHLYCIKLMKSCTPEANFKNRIDAKNKTKALKWREGRTYAFLLDIFDPGKKDTIRVFIQTSACNPPYGFPPAAELGKKKVDLAILCVASYAYVHNYPEAILSLLKPGKTILVHWENFFAGMYKKNPKSVPGTRLAPFMKRLRKHYGKKNYTNDSIKPFFMMPKPLTQMKVFY